mmetsp:Transcript_6552/g.8857  ORF Transcript_6552/g.8857 Transcript_6552/m.8857 type:complete len:94 (-) Transcript_6552:147-428(-)
MGDSHAITSLNDIYSMVKREKIYFCTEDHGKRVKKTMNWVVRMHYWIIRKYILHAIKIGTKRTVSNIASVIIILNILNSTLWKHKAETTKHYF